jgi:hypothetical protein
MKIFKLVTFLALLLCTGCGTLEIGIEHKPSKTATANILPTASTQPTDQPVATAPVEQPSPTAAPIPPTESPLPTEALVPPTPTYAAPTATPGPQFVQIYLIAVDDNGQSGQPVGCGDSVIPVKVEISPTKEVLRASLEKLLALKDQFYGESGLYNALYQSDLQVESISLENGKATIHLTGTMLLGGECDNPRFEAQLESTVLQFSSIQEAAIFINGKPLKEALSLK